MAATITDDTTHVVFSNPLATLKLKKANAASEFLALSGGENTITPPVRFAAYHDGSNLIPAQSVSYMSTSAWKAGLFLNFTAGQVVVLCRAYETHFSFELLEMGDGLASSASQILIARLRIEGDDAATLPESYTVATLSSVGSIRYRNSHHLHVPKLAWALAHGAAGGA